MKKFAGLLVMGMLWAVQNAAAQSYAETAMMFSRTKPTGSARILGMGGAQISLGGDYSSAYSNPAGLGMYNRSEVSLSPGYLNVGTNGDYFSGGDLLSSNNMDSKTNLNFSGLGLVFSKELQGSDIIRGTFAITLSRTNNFNRSVSYSGNNPNTSLIDYFINDASGYTTEQFEPNGGLYNTVTELAYNNYLIGPETVLDPDGDPTAYFTDVAGMPYQQETILQEGGQNQWNFSYGVNVGDKYYLGAGVGLSSINYTAQKSYYEEFSDDPLFHFNLDESLQIRGSGVNFTAGLIARPVEYITLGVTAATPTWYNLTDTWNADMSSSWDNFEYEPGVFLNDEDAGTDMVVSEYKLATPWRVGAGATVFIEKSGLISLDVEHVNYSTARYKSRTSGVDYDSDNERIIELYRSRTNVRLGGELRVEALRLRAGIGRMGDPFSTKQNGVDQRINTYSGGIGYRADKFFIDLAYQYSQTKGSYRPYPADGPQPLLEFDQVSNNIVTTIGFTF